MKELQIKFLKESDRLSLLTFLCNYGFRGYVDSTYSQNPKSIDENTSFQRWPILLIRNDNKTIYFRFSANSGDPLYNWPENAASIINAIDKVPVTVKLNETYTAEINEIHKTVAVGCQTIPFSSIEELYKEIQKVNA